MKGREGRAELIAFLYALVFAAPLAIGAVHPTTQVLLGGGALVLFLATAFVLRTDRGLRVPPFAWIGIAALAWTALQLLPLPLGLLRLLSPHAAELRDETGAHFAPITLDVPATTLELCKLATYVCALLVGGELLRRSTRRVAAVLGIFGGVVVAILWSHRLTGATTIYGFYVPQSLPGSGLFPPFVNGNNAASLLALCALAAAGAAFGRSDRRGPIFGVLAFVAAASVLGTASRGGAVGLAAGLLFLVTVLAGQRFGRARALGLSVAVIVTLGAGALLIADGLRGRLQERSNAASVGQKTRGWTTGLELANRYPLVGVGRGAFEAPGAGLREHDEGVRLVFPENVVMQVVSEWGWPCGLALLGALVWGFVSTLRRCRLEPALAGLAAGVIAVAVHELFDFGLEFPGVALPTTLALAALVAAAESDDRTRRRPRLRVRALALAPTGIFGSLVVALGYTAAQHTLSSDLARNDDFESSIRRHPASAELEMQLAASEIEAHDTSALHHLGRAMRLQPNAGRPHALAALELERAHRYGQAALEYRLARERDVPIDDAALIRHLGRFAIDAMPKQADAYERIGALYAAQKRYDDATRAYERAVEMDAGSGPRLKWLSWMPVDRQPHVLEAMERAAQDDEELAVVINGWATLKDFTRGERVAVAAMLRFPKSAHVAVSTARMRLAQNDIEGARQAIGRTMRFDDMGRLQAEEALVDVAKRAGDLDQLAAAEARLRLLRAKVHMDEPLAGGTHP